MRAAADSSLCLVLFVADARTGAPAKTSASSRTRIPTVKRLHTARSFTRNCLLLFEWFAAFVAVVLAERRGSTEHAPQSNAAVHAELSPSSLLVMTNGADLGGLGLRDGQYEAHSCCMTDGLAERVLPTSWWCFLPVHCFSSWIRWCGVLICFVFHAWPLQGLCGRKAITGRRRRVSWNTITMVTASPAIAARISWSTIPTGVRPLTNVVIMVRILLVGTCEPWIRTVWVELRLAPLESVTVRTTA